MKKKSDVRIKKLEVQAQNRWVYWPLETVQLQRSRRTEDTEPCWVKLDLDETTKEFQAEKIQESWSPVWMSDYISVLKKNLSNDSFINFKQQLFLEITFIS